MSAIYFHEQSLDENVAVRGSERAMASLLVGDLAMCALRGIEPKKLSDYLPVDRHLQHADRGNPREDLRLMLNFGEVSLQWKGASLDIFPVLLNTAWAIGGDPTRLLARLHAQCEIHAYVEGPNRAWLAKIIEDGLLSRMYRQNRGWKGAIELLRARDNEPVITSYSVCDRFPNAGIAGWEDESDGDDWYELDNSERWRMALEQLRSYGSREMRPDQWSDYFFEPNVNLFDVAMAVNETPPEASP